MKSSREQKVINHWVNQNCWPMTESTVEQWFPTKDACNGATAEAGRFEERLCSRSNNLKKGTATLLHK